LLSSPGNIGKNYPRNPEPPSPSDDMPETGARVGRYDAYAVSTRSVARD
jgi:hypothetical protein